MSYTLTNHIKGIKLHKRALNFFSRYYGQKSILFFFILSTGLSGCQPEIDTGNFDTAKWKSDPLGCKGIRPELVAALEAIRPNLYRHNNRAIIKVLGRPDAEELRAGNQKVFFYYLEEGPQCTQKDHFSKADKVLIRFNAMNQVSEVSYSQPLGDIIRRDDTR